MKKLMLLLGTLVISAFFFSCATTLPITVSHPPRIDTSGIERMVILPFEGFEQSGQIASSITSIFRSRISATGKFKLVEPVAYKPNQGMVDAIFKGEINDYTLEDSTHEEERNKKDKNGEIVTYLQTVYTRVVSVEFTYRIIRDRDGSVIGERTLSGTKTVSNDSKAKLESGVSMAKSIAESKLGDFEREILPWTSEEKLTLDKETSKDKALKQRMKDAEALVKAGNLKTALDTYAEIYAETKSPAAGYNQAILAQSQDSLDTAISLMSALVDATGYAKARTELTRLRGFRGQNAAAEANKAGTSAQDLAIKKASTELLAALPASSRVSLLNISKSETDRVDVVIREITEALIAGGITVLDRQNIDAINAEKQYQASGEVSDDSFVSIGHMLGVDTIVTFSITGSTSQRKLTIKSISVETGKTLYNASTEI